MTAQSPGQGDLATPPPELVPQQEIGLRLLRILLIVLVLSGWFVDSLRDPARATGVILPGANWSDLASLATLILLIVGPQPRWATKWAWFWLIDVVPLAAVFLLLEPVPVWQGEPASARPSRLTGGWAFLLALVLKAVLSAMAFFLVQPWLAVMGGTWGIGAPGGSFLP